MSEELKPGERYAGQFKSRAEVLCAIDCIMHHLNDECDNESWLALGVPDGGPWDVLGADTPDTRLEYYMQFAENGDEFEEMVELFAKIIRRVCFGRGDKYCKAGIG